MKNGAGEAWWGTGRLSLAIPRRCSLPAPPRPAAPRSSGGEGTFQQVTRWDAMRWEAAPPPRQI